LTTLVPATQSAMAVSAQRPVTANSVSITHMSRILTTMIGASVTTGGPETTAQFTRDGVTINVTAASALVLVIAMNADTMPVLITMATACVIPDGLKTTV
jgi:hypothetical protein